MSRPKYNTAVSSRSSLWRQAKTDLSSTLDNACNVDVSCSTNVVASCSSDSFEQLSSMECIEDDELSVNDQTCNDCVIPSACVPTESLYSDLRDADDSEIGWRWQNFDSDDDSDLDKASGSSLRKQLAEWAVTYKIQQSAVGSLLKIMGNYFTDLPRDARTLLSTPTSTSFATRPINGGEYCHVGLAKGLEWVAAQNPKSFDHFELQINIDGIPLFRSSSTVLWPILCAVKNSIIRKPFVVGLFCGKEKPCKADEYLADFVCEAADLLQNGLCIGGKHYSVYFHAFICDAPARAFIKGIKCHSGYASCEKCTVHGEYYAGKVIFPSVNCPLRTDDEFNAMSDEDHHVTSCPLNPLPLGFVTQFGLDYMHLGCLGVMRRFILYWKGPVGPLSVRLGRSAILALSSRMSQLASYTPLEFARKPRSFDYVPRWKATEFRQFMMYSGSVVLSGILPDHLYNHFLLLFVAMRILASEELSTLYCDYASELLKLFVQQTEVLYGKEALVYNVHSLIHLAVDVKKFGCLDEFSAFTFENTLGQLKKFIRKPQHPIQQILRRLEELHLNTSGTNSHVEPVVRCEHSNGPVVPAVRNGKQYKHLQTDKFCLSLSTGNNCVMIEGGIPVMVKNIVLGQDSSLSLVCAKFAVVSDAFKYPLQSSKLGICKVNSKMDYLVVIPLKDILCKYVCWPALSEEDSLILLPLLHQHIG